MKKSWLLRTSWRISPRVNKALDRCCELALKQPLPNKQIALMTDASFSAAGYAVLIEDDPLEKYTSTRKTFATVAYGSKTFSPTQLKMSIYAKEFLAILFAFKEFGHKFWVTPKPVIILTDNQSVTRLLQTKIIPPTLWNACDYVIQFNFTVAHIPGKNNTAADYLSRLEISPKEKLILRIREDIPTTPIELHVQSAGVSEEEQIFYTDDDVETEEQILQRKKDARAHPAHQLPDISFEKLTTHKSQYHKLSTIQKLTSINSIAVEQNNDIILQQLRLKILKENYSESIPIDTNITVAKWTDCPLQMKSSPGSILMKQGQLNTIRCSCQSIKSQNSLNPYMGKQLNTLAYPRCLSKFDKNFFIQEFRKLSKNGFRDVKFVSRTNEFPNHPIPLNS